MQQQQGVLPQGTWVWAVLQVRLRLPRGHVHQRRVRRLLVQIGLAAQHIEQPYSVTAEDGDACKS